MGFKDILVHVDATASSRTRLQIGLTLARGFGARMAGLHVIPEPAVPPYFKPSVVERIAAIYAENAREAAAAAEVLFRQETKDAGVSTVWECIAGDMEVMIGERARFADLLVLGQFDTENPPMISAFLLPAKVVFGAATPILVVPNAWSFGDVGRSVVIAWDGSREAARSIRDAMPFLEVAERVLVLALDPERQGHMHAGAHTDEIVAYLNRHGVRVEAAEMRSDSKGVTMDLLEQTDRHSANLLVMGAYGHSPLWEFAVGGTTANVLEQTTIPVLMSR